MAQPRSNRVNVVLDEEHAEKLHRLAERTYMNPGSLARSLLSSALDEIEPDAGRITDILDRIPGALESAHRGRGEIRSGKGIPLDEL